MKLSLLLVFFFTIAGLCSPSESRTRPDDYRGIIKEQPLMFGRRGMNPNMNSLFFGKRSSSSDVSLRELKRTCAMMMAYDEESLFAKDEV